MLGTKVELSKFFPLSVELDSRVVASKLLMLLTDTQMGHDLDCYEIAQLVVQALNFRVGSITACGPLMSDLSPQTITALLGKSQSLFRVV